MVAAHLKISFVGFSFPSALILCVGSHNYKRWFFWGRKGRKELNARDAQAFRVLNRGVLQATRWFLLLVCFIAGGFLLLEGKSTSFGILLLLIGLWLVLDNALEGFELLEGPCPFCGHEIRIRRRVKFSCPVCDKPMIVGAHSFHGENSSTGANLDLKMGKESLEHVSQAEPVVLTPNGILDLHTFSPEEVPSLLDEFFRASLKDGIDLVKIIHGKGTGALRRRVHGLLAHDPRVVTYYDAPPKSGGWGATVVELRRCQEDD